MLANIFFYFKVICLALPLSLNQHSILVDILGQTRYKVIPKWLYSLYYILHSTNKCSMATGHAHSILYNELSPYNKISIVFFKIYLYFSLGFVDSNQLHFCGPSWDGDTNCNEVLPVDLVLLWLPQLEIY